MGEKGILLAFIKTVDFVNKEERFLAICSAEFLGLLNNLSYFLHT